MPKVKLTLLVDAEAVQSAKRHAHARRTSVSALATQFFQPYFEDAIQYASAVSIQAACRMSRNLDDFPRKGPA